MHLYQVFNRFFVILNIPFEILPHAHTQLFTTEVFAIMYQLSDDLTAYNDAAYANPAMAASKRAAACDCIVAGCNKIYAPLQLPHAIIPTVPDDANPFHTINQLAVETLQCAMNMCKQQEN